MDYAEKEMSSINKMVEALESALQLVKELVARRSWLLNEIRRFEENTT